MTFEFKLNGYRQLIFLAVVGFFLAAKPHAATAGAAHACDYLSTDEVARVMGFEVGAPERKPANPMGESICFFDAPPAQGMKFAQLGLVTSASEKLKKLGFTAASFFDNNTGFMDNPLKVDGLGEKAFWGGAGMKMGAGLHVYYREVSFTVLAKAASEEESLTKSKALAKIVIDKIK